ncbi:NUDIX hydrolase [Halorussus litoreus]|uniref:NUDIX hydrolase n=1 Tax=Halorussus litoreus TaxID=1710536 RepID=UPI001E582217|nr:NUDIX hydrolase [Halorussus litoreus]
MTDVPASHDLAPDAPRERQTLRLPEPKLDSLREWAVEGTALTAAARVRDPDGRTALVKNRWSDGWILPGGAVEPGESPTEAARREVREETGLDATVGEPVVVLDQSYVAEGDGKQHFTARYVVYAARAEGEIPDASQLGTSEDEIEAARWFETLPAALHDGDLLRPYL